MSDFNEQIKRQKEIIEKMMPAIKSAQNLIASFNRINSDFFRTVQIITETTSKFADVLKIRKWFDELDKAGFTPNLGRDRSYRKLKKYLKLLNSGYAIFWIPREEIIEKLLDSQNKSDRKRIILGNKKLILDDCEKALNSVINRDLKNTKDHLKSAIHSLRQSNYRAAQSAATVCFDAQLDQIIDTSTLSRGEDVGHEVRKKTNQLTKDFKQIPIHLIFAALQSFLIKVSLGHFNRVKPKTVRLKFNRHSSIHSVSARQYNENNAILAIMTATSLLLTTSRLGKGWLARL